MITAGVALAQPAIRSAKASRDGTDAAPDENRFSVAFALPVKFLYLEQPTVRDEIKLTKRQIEELEKIKAVWAETARKTNFVDDDELRKKLTQTIPKQIDETLTAAQVLRLRQIVLRHCEREKGLPAAVATVANDLELTLQQRERFEAMRRKRAETVVEHLTSGERFTAIRLKVFESNNEHVEEFKRLLTEAQRAKLTALLGEPFKGEIRLKQPEAVRPTPITSVYREKLFDSYALEAEFLINESVQKELQMSDDQIRKAKEFHVEWSKRFEEGKKAEPDLAKVLQSLDLLVTKELKGILDKRGQRERFISIMVQHRQKAGGLAAACGYPEVADAIGLSVAQSLSLRAGKPPDEVLSGKQRDTYARIVGLPFKGELRIDDPFAAPKKVEAPAFKPAVVPVFDERKLHLAGYMIDNAKQLKLTDEQIARLKEIAEDAPKLKELLHRELSNLPPSTDLATLRNASPEAGAVNHYRKAIVEQCLEVLDEKQRSLHEAALKRAARDY
jgi:hypothetical protein